MGAPFDGTGRHRRRDVAGEEPRVAHRAQRPSPSVLSTSRRTSSPLDLVDEEARSDRSAARDGRRRPASGRPATVVDPVRLESPRGSRARWPGTVDAAPPARDTVVGGPADAPGADRDVVAAPHDVRTAGRACADALDVHRRRRRASGSRRRRRRETLDDASRALRSSPSGSMPAPACPAGSTTRSAPNPTTAAVSRPNRPSRRLLGTFEHRRGASTCREAPEAGAAPGGVDHRSNPGTPTDASWLITSSPTDERVACASVKVATAGFTRSRPGTARRPRSR